MMVKKIKERINLLFWKIRPAQTGLECIAHIALKPFEKLTVTFEDKKIEDKFRFENLHYDLHEIVYIIHDKLLIEPAFSCAVKGWNYIIEQTLFFPRLRPSLISWMRFKLKRSSIRKTFTPEAVLFDNAAGTNYFHFFTDIINKIWLIEKYGFDRSVPLIIREKTFITKHFQFLYKNTILGSFNWIVQKKDDYIQVNKLIILQPMPFDTTLWNKTISLVNRFRSQERAWRKVFLTRSVKNGRYAINHDEIESLMKENGFEIIDTTDREVQDQIKLFSEIKYLISLHGAGETNIMFSQPDQLHFLEINPSNRISGQYYWLSSALGIKYYDCILGSDLENADAVPQGGFSVEPDLLRSSIDKLLKS
jgi:hypothetical protein